MKFKTHIGPSSSLSLSLCHFLSGDGATHDTEIGDGGMLVFNPLVAIGRALKAWPLPLVVSLEISLGSVYSTGGMMLYHSKKSHDTALNKCWQTLGLPAEAASWGSMKILDLFQQDKVTAFVSGSHRRLGAASQVSRLNEQTTLILIADEVLGRQGLRKEWCGPIST